MSVIKRIYKSFMQGPIYIVLFGMVFFGIGAGLTYRQILMERNGALAQGEVISLSMNCDDDGCTYSPVVRFETESGKSVSFESTFSSSPPAYQVGESVQVIYSEEAPEKAEIKGSGRIFRYVFMIVGGLIISFGLYMFGSILSDEFSKGESG